MESESKPKWIDYELLCEDVHPDKHRLFMETYKQDVNFIGMVSLLPTHPKIAGTKYAYGVYRKCKACKSSSVLANHLQLGD